ncbi:hypothetical protein ACFOHW_25330 [Paenibacillus abyssi]
MESEQHRINADRTAMIEDLLEAFKRLSADSLQREERVEKLTLKFTPESGLSVEGAIDSISVKGFAYLDVHLGERFTRASHFPRSILIRLGLLD